MDAGARTGSQTLHARNSSKEPLRAFSFFITRGLKIETGLDRDPEIDRGHLSYKRLTIQEYSEQFGETKSQSTFYGETGVFWSLFVALFGVFLKEAPLLQW